MAYRFAKMEVQVKRKAAIFHLAFANVRLRMISAKRGSDLGLRECSILPGKAFARWLRSKAFGLIRAYVCYF